MTLDNSDNDKNKQKVVLILGLSRIGSTVLDIALGCQENIVGLGEIQELLRPEWQRYNKTIQCTCGQNSKLCNFWSPICEWLGKNSDKSMAEKYEYCINAFSKFFGPGFTLVDSSKNLSALENLLQQKQVELKIIYLIRDVRSWTISKLDDRINDPNKFKKNGFYINNLIHNLGLKAKIFSLIVPWLSKQPFYYFFAWYHQNKIIKQRLEKLNLEYFQISYELFALNPEVYLRQLMAFITGTERFTSELSNSQSHIITGNPKRNDKNRNKGIYYDQRWMSRNEWLLSYHCLPWIRSYNIDEVYNTSGIQRTGEKL